ncbi:MAG TPA: carboxymuconolactone decarboxylase family protein [Nannocystis exedens]|nr:carboxymuconolactone decarboxylase family protein [Nannocystis exedens]
MKFEVHTQKSAPSPSQPLLGKSVKKWGMLPNLHGVMAESPELLEAYQRINELFVGTSFDAEELTVVWQTVNVEHECDYCVPAHSAIAKMMKVDDAITAALRSRSELPTKKLQALHLTTLALVKNRGHLSDEERDAFFAEGYERRHLLEIVLGISMKVMSNYTNHLAKTPLDPAFEGFV